ncbi:thioredoxin [Methanoplanus sp. FWC-SCC4]|uniref:Thioredoxin n=1 Tax=Methanochimaera problematica TaxID=2609417 RepID=A0AA97FBH3_9EURY|nr:thioredoxin [Methanoplanus sp. FWC-SCC4]WOF15198.1 thioredoxin [Methanoplanus sp. FWC-SCC4]
MTDNTFDDEIKKIREKKLEELSNMVQKSKNPGVTEITGINFNDFISKNSFVVIDLWAEWCGPCRRVAPVIEELSSEYAGRVAFGKCNTDENQSLAASFQITAIPTLLFFANGRMVHRLTGAYPKENIISAINRAFPL